MKKTALLSLVALFLSVFATAQGTLKGKLVDSTTSKALGLATVSVFKAADTVLVSYRLSTPEGEFKVPNLPYNIDLRVVISFSGYGVYRKEFMIKNDQPVYEMGTVNMLPDAKSLDEVLVIAERPPVVIKKDTIEFNASAFKTLPNALVEDLLKKLPGVQVDAEGNIMVNGKPVNRILVDGKTFFGDDPKMATRNLPANVIDKVQVADDKEEMLRNGDDNPNNVGKVVNITLKKGVKKGWFGKLYAGAGTDKLYEAGGIANIYRDTLQVSVLGYANNMNKAGFSYSELMQAGGMERNRSNMQGSSTSIWNNSSGGSGVSINGVNFGGAQNYGGVATSRGAGFNLNHAPNKKRSFFAQYFHGNVHIDRLTTTQTQQFSGDTVITNNTRLNGDVVTNGHNFGIGARLKPDSVTNFLFNANYTLGLSEEDRVSLINSANNKLGPLSEGDISQGNIGKTRYYRHFATITRLSKTKKGRRFTISQGLDINNRYNDNGTQTDISFLYPAAYDSLNAQLRLERIPRTDATLTANYSEPLSKSWTFRVTGRYEYSWLHNDISTMNKDGNGEFKLLNPLLSSRFKRTSHRTSLSPGIEFKWKDLTITPGVRLLMQNVNNNLASLPDPLVQKKTDLLPSFNIAYKQLNFNYSKDIVLPGFNNLVPVADNTNPYFIQKGNTALLPMERSFLNLNCYFSDRKRNLNVGGYTSYSFTKNDIVQSITVDDKGVQTTIPVNMNGYRNFSMNVNLNKQYKNNQKFIFSWNVGNGINFNRNRLLYNGAASWQTNAYLNWWGGINMNWNDKVEWNSNVGLGSNYTKYTNPAFRQIKVKYRSWGNELVVRWPRHVIWETQCNYSFNSNMPAGVPREIIRWNAALNFTMLKNEAGVLKFSAFDLLNKNRNASAFTNRNVLTLTETNALSQYFMATFTYNVRAAGVKKKVGGRENFFLF